MSHLRVKLEDGLCVTLSLSLLPSRLFRHLEALVDTWEVHLLESAQFALAWRRTVHEGELTVVDSNCI